jgi:hypothetical protein
MERREKKNKDEKTERTKKEGNEYEFEKGVISFCCRPEDFPGHAFQRLFFKI